MSLLLLLKPTAVEDPGTDPGPQPEPEPIVTSGVPGGKRSAPVRVAVRINGELYVGTYDEISALIASLGERDAADEVANAPVPVATSKRTARNRARKAAGDFARSTQVIDIGLPKNIDIGELDPGPIVLRELRDQYLRAYAQALLDNERAVALAIQREAEQQAWIEEQARIEAEREADDLDAINRVLELL